MESVDVVVVGAGVVGLAVARALALAGREVIVLEQRATFGTETSSRNSEVIHAGLYYPPGSLKARCCVHGKALLYAYCETKQIAHLRVGKLIVAGDAAERAVLDEYAARARANGVMDLRRVSATEIAALEPAITAQEGLYSPSTGIIDSHGLMLHFVGDIEAHGGAVIYLSPLRGARLTAEKLVIDVGGDQPTSVACCALINAAGLHAQTVARRIGLSERFIPPCHYAIGHYYGLVGRNPFRHLVYPIADTGGLGVHVSLDLAGQARFGPDVRWLDSIDYHFDDSARAAFVRSIKRYYPAIEYDNLAPAYTGIRPKLVAAGEPPADFRIDGPAYHGIPGLINLFGIESPGLTAALAIAELVAAAIKA